MPEAQVAAPEPEPTPATDSGESAALLPGRPPTAAAAGSQQRTFESWDELRAEAGVPKRGGHPQTFESGVEVPAWLHRKVRHLDLRDNPIAARGLPQSQPATAHLGLVAHSA